MKAVPKFPIQPSRRNSQPRMPQSSNLEISSLRILDHPFVFLPTFFMAFLRVIPWPSGFLEPSTILLKLIGFFVLRKAVFRVILFLVSIIVSAAHGIFIVNNNLFGFGVTGRSDYLHDSGVNRRGPANENGGSSQAFQQLHAADLNLL